MKNFLVEDKIVLDTSVIVEYIIEGSPYEDKLEKIFKSSNKTRVYVNLVTLSEVLYVSDRIYRLAGVDDSNEKASEFLSWISSKSTLIPVDEEISILAGEVKKKFRLSLSDSYAIATGLRLRSKILFKKIEREMVGKLDKLRDLGVTFLDEIP